MIPDYIYRGDRDSNRIRHLKTTLHHGQLQSNLINGGTGRVISETPLLELIDKHVNIGWDTTHFLSFSEDKLSAYRFGLHCDLLEVEDKLQQYSEVYDDFSNWEFAIVAIDFNSIKFKEIEYGVYAGHYPPTLNAFRELEKVRILLINVYEFLSTKPGMENSKKNAKRDKEWLVLPATPKQFNARVEFSAILDGGCIHEYRLFKKN